MTRVLPLPAPAKTRTFPSVVRTAFSCAALILSSRRKVTPSKKVFENSFLSRTNSFRGLSNFASHLYPRPDIGIEAYFEIPSKISSFSRESNSQTLSKNLFLLKSTCDQLFFKKIGRAHV